MRKIKPPPFNARQNISEERLPKMRNFFKFKNASSVTGKITAKRILTITVCPVLLAAVILACINIGDVIKRVGSEAVYGDYDINLIYYNHLSLKQKKLYNSITDASELCSEYTEILDYTYDENDITKVIKYIRAEHPELFYVDFGSLEIQNSYRKSMVKMAYCASSEQIDIMKKELEYKLGQIVSLTAESEENFRKILILHDALIASCSPVNSDESSNPLYRSAYGAIVLGKASADGYAQAYGLLLEKSGIYSCLVFGNQRKSGANLVWNLVCDNGNYYHVDTLWDDPEIPENPDTALHAYFAISTTEISFERNIYDREIIPSSENVPDYYSLVLRKANNEQELADILAPLIAELEETGTRYGEIYVPFSPSDEQLYGAITDAIRNVNIKSENGKLILAIADTYPISDRPGYIVFKLYYADETTKTNYSKFI